MHSTKLSLSLGLILISFGLLTGCDSNVTNNYYTTPASDTSGGPATTSTITVTPSQSVTPTPTPSPSATPAPSATPIPTATPITATPTPDPITGGTSASPTPVPSITPAPTPSPTPGNVNNLPIAPIQSAEINGTAGAVPTEIFSVVSANLLKVKISPQAAPNLTLPGYTNWVFPYGCVRLEVTVNGVTKITDILKVDGVVQNAGSVCENAPTSQVLDFSADISASGPSSVTISNAQYDNCRYVNPLTYGCGMSAIFQNHIVGTFVQIETDSTYMDEGASILNPSPTPDPSASPTPSPTPIGTPSPIIGG